MAIAGETTAGTAKVTCREIGPAMLPATEAVLREGFPERSAAFWQRALGRLASRPVPEGYPRFGYLLRSGDRPVGCLLTIFSGDPGSGVRCNLSAYYTHPDFRPYASMLTLRALRRPEVTYLNISPRPATLPLLKAQGYQRYAEGSLLIAPVLLPARKGAVAVPFNASEAPAEGLSAPEQQLLSEHARLGCVCLLVRGPDGARPYVFQHRRVVKRLLPATQLIYCRSIEDFAADAGVLGRYLAARGAALMLTDTDGSTPALPGRLIRLPKYYKGPHRPRLGDLSHTELPLFGI